MPRSSGQNAMPQPRDRVGRPPDQLRGRRSAPSRARRRTMPMTDLSVVVLPAPLRPSSVTTSPGPHVEVDAVEDVRLVVPGVQVAHRRTASSGRRVHAGEAAGLRYGLVPDHVRIARDRGVVALGEHLAARQHGDACRRGARPTLRLCSTISTVRLAATRLISAEMRSTSSWPMPAVGSSSSIISGSSASVVAISSARLRPYGSSTAASPRERRRARPPRSARALARRAPPGPAPSARSRTSRPRCRWSAMRTFSSTVRCGNTAEIWNERTQARGARCRPGASPVMSRPLKRDAPAGRREEVREQVEAGRLARAVRGR